MCLLLFYLHPAATAGEFCLIMVNVRDEIYDRPTKIAHFWNHHPDVIGGMDIEPGKEGGTWLAMSKRGKIAALLNVLQPDDEISANKKGRGFLAVNYVTKDIDCLEYLHNISLEGNAYNGFTLVTMDLRSLSSPKVAYFSNASISTPITLEAGIHAFGNSISVNHPWSKVKKAKEKFSEIVSHHHSMADKDVLVESLFSLLTDSTCHALDENMLKQGRGKSSQFLDKLSAIFVHIPEYNYGSRCHTIILVNGSGDVDYFERNRNENSELGWSVEHFSYKLVQ